VRSLSQLNPLLEGTTSLVLNGDTLDTRPNEDMPRTAALRSEVLDFFSKVGTPVHVLTGNHDPDLSAVHELEFASGQVLVTHGDILFDNIVPWSRNAPMIRAKIIAALAALPEDGACALTNRLKAFRSVAATIPQLHQSERRLLKYALRLAGDTIWPPHRGLKILQSWREAPERAAALATRHRPKARYVLIGHTHRPGVWKTQSGVVVVNTGSFCTGFGGMAADVSADTIRVRRIELKRGAFRPGPEVAVFPLS
jgi:predicted phosphodiesterase